MLLKKINAACALLTTVILVLHSAITSLTPLIGLKNKPPIFFEILFVAIFAVHIILSLLMIVLSEKYKVKVYPNVEKSWLIQRITAILIIPFAFLHFFVFKEILPAGIPVIFIMHFLLMIITYIHISLSVPNALVTLGFAITIKRHKVIRAICFAIGVLLLLLGLAASIVEVIRFS